MYLKSKLTDGGYKILTWNERKTIYRIYWQGSKSIMKNSEDEITYQSEQNTPRTIINFTWNQKYLIEYNQENFEIFCKNYLKGEWGLISDNCEVVLSKRKAIKTISFDNELFAKFDFDEIYFKYDHTFKIELSLALYFTLHPPWSELPFN